MPHAHNNINCLKELDGSPVWMKVSDIGDRGRGDNHEGGRRLQKELVCSATWYRGEGWHVTMELPNGRMVYFARFKKYLNTKAEITKRMISEVTDYLRATPESDWGCESWSEYQKARTEERIAHRQARTA